MKTKIIERIKDLFLWRSAHVFTINYDLGQVTIRTHNGFRHFFYDPDTETCDLKIGEKLKYRFIKTNGKEQIVTRTLYSD